MPDIMTEQTMFLLINKIQHYFYQNSYVYPKDSSKNKVKLDTQSLEIDKRKLFK